MVIHTEPHKLSTGARLRDVILGEQDGLVNVLGIIFAVAAATTSSKLVIIAGLGATFAESISMAAVAYTSLKAEKDHYKRELEREKREIEELPEIERKEIRDIYIKKGFRGRLLSQVVRRITSNKRLWLDTMMKEELNLAESSKSPGKSAALVGFAAVLGSIVPLLPFFFLPVPEGMTASIILSLAVLFITGAIKARITVGNWLKTGIEMALIGIGAAIVGFLIGTGLNMLLA
jgi:VIT1/CCC1 family predicted Fe2+/Mn2+ transporter